MASMLDSPAAVVRHFHRRLGALGTPARAAGAKAYMKSALRFHGVMADDLRDRCAAFCKAHPLDARSLRAAVDALYATDWFELRSHGDRMSGLTRREATKYLNVP
jgi:hypothetical protein